MGPERAKSVEHRVLADVFCFFGLENRKNAECSLKTFFVSLRRFLHSLHVASVVSGRYVLRSGSQRVLRSAPQRGPRLRSGLSAPLRSRLHDPSLLTRRSVRSEKSWDPKKSFENKRFFCSLVKKKSQQELLVFSQKFRVFSVLTNFRVFFPVLTKVLGFECSILKISQ